MNVETFFEYWGLEENPFKAEEARDDPVYHRIMGSEMTHPDFEKIYGSPIRPSTAVVFGEKGSGKTAIRLLLEDRLQKHNVENPDRKVWVEKIDDLNPFIDTLMARAGKTAATAEELKAIRLVDHMDYLLSLSVTRLVSFILGEDLEDFEKPRKARKRLRRMHRQKRLDLAELAALYDRPESGTRGHRWKKLSSALRVGRAMNLQMTSAALLLASLSTAALCIAVFAINMMSPEVLVGLGIATVLTFVTGIKLIRERWLYGGIARKVSDELRVMKHNCVELNNQLGDLAAKDLVSQPIPIPGDQDSRYDLTSRLMSILDELGYISMVVLYDRIDEPTAINGDASKMKAVIWPVFNNKFLQQNGIGMKLLLPIELGHELKREGSDFYQQARFDKQNLVERLEWTGATLYDICSKRLQSCQGSEGKIRKLADLFDEDITHRELVEALDQMQQPRDAFKFLYRVIQEHCLNSTDEEPQWRIPKLVLDQTRKQQSQRVQDLYRGLTPA